AGPIRPTVAPAGHLEEWLRLSAELGHPWLGAKLHDRRCARVPVTYSLDLLSKIIDSLAAAPARGDEGVCFGTDRVDEVDKARVLPWVLRLAGWTKFPFGLAEVPELVTIRQPLSRLSHHVFDRLALVPFHPAGCSGESHKRDAFLELYTFFAFGPFPVGILQQRALDDALGIFGFGIAPPVATLYSWKILEEISPFQMCRHCPAIFPH